MSEAPSNGEASFFFLGTLPALRTACCASLRFSLTSAGACRRFCCRQSLAMCRILSCSLHDTVLKRYRVAAGSARTIHDYLRPPRLPSLPRFFHPSRLFSLRDPSYTHDSAIEIATGIAPHDSAMEIATGIAPASSRTRRPKLHSPPLNFPLAATQHSPPPVKSPVKILDARTRTQDFRELSPLCISTYHITISSLEKFHITCPSRSSVHLLWISECVCE